MPLSDRQFQATIENICAGLWVLMPAVSLIIQEHYSQVSPTERTVFQEHYSQSARLFRAFQKLEAAANDCQRLLSANDRPGTKDTAAAGAQPGTQDTAANAKPSTQDTPDTAAGAAPSTQDTAASDLRDFKVKNEVGETKIILRGNDMTVEVGETKIIRSRSRTRRSASRSRTPTPGASPSPSHTWTFQGRKQWRKLREQAKSFRKKSHANLEKIEDLKEEASSRLQVHNWLPGKRKKGNVTSDEESDSSHFFMYGRRAPFNPTTSQSGATSSLHPMHIRTLETTDSRLWGRLDRVYHPSVEGWRMHSNDRPGIPDAYPRQVYPLSAERQRMFDNDLMFDFELEAMLRRNAERGSMHREDSIASDSIIQQARLLHVACWPSAASA